MTTVRDIKQLRNAGKRNLQARDVASAMQKYELAYQMARDSLQYVQKKEKAELIMLMDDLYRVIQWYRELNTAHRKR